MKLFYILQCGVKVKPLLLGVFIGSVLICVVIVIVVSHFVAKREKKKR